MPSCSSGFRSQIMKSHWQQHHNLVLKFGFSMLWTISVDGRYNHARCMNLQAPAGSSESVRSSASVGSASPHPSAQAEPLMSQLQKFWGLAGKIESHSTNKELKIKLSELPPYWSPRPARRQPSPPSFSNASGPG